MPQFRWIAVCFGFGLVLVPQSRAQAESLRCKSRLVSTGDTAYELRARCGAPNHVYARTELRAEGFSLLQASSISRRRGRQTNIIVPGAIRQIRYTREQVETWIYLLGPHDLSRVVTVRRGKVVDISTLGPLDLPNDPGCQRAMFSSGDLEAMVYISCGEPDDRSAWEEEQEIAVGGFIERRLIQRQRWVYNPGRGNLLRVFEFANGRLLKVRTAGRSP